MSAQRITVPFSSPYTGLVDEINVHLDSWNCTGPMALGIDNAALASAAWTANRLLFLPFVTDVNLLVAQFFWVNGATAAGNTDVGIYSFDGQTKIGSTGSTANSGTSAVQSVNVTDFSLGADQRYWLALGCDSSTHTYFASSMRVEGWDYAGAREELSGWSSGLPGTITFAVPSVTVTPMFGFTGSSVF
jgi:hypothetical protein